MKRQRLSTNFYLDEFQCNCARPDCDAPKYPEFRLVDLLQSARDACGFPFPINSWARCPFWNRAVDGEPESFHLKGLAVDIGCTDSQKRAKLVYELLKRGFSVSVYPSWIHADLGRPDQILLYGKK